MYTDLNLGEVSMATLTAPILGGTVRGTASGDTITGSAFQDTLWGFGGNDVLNGGAGDDNLNGDGVYTVNDAIANEGKAIAAYTGTVSSPTGLQLTSMGISGLSSAWRIRNLSLIHI